MFNKKEYDKEFKKKNYMRIYLSFNKEKDKDIIEVLKAQKNKPDYIRNLIKNDLKKEK